jgi:hypothetical protein
LVGIGSAAAGHGNYFLGKLLFPFTMCSALLLGSITAPFILIAVAQYPIYGLITGLANRRGRLRLVSGILLLVHGLVALACLAVRDPSL